MTDQKSSEALQLKVLELESDPKKLRWALHWITTYLSDSELETMIEYADGAAADVARRVAERQRLALLPAPRTDTDGDEI